MATDPGISIRRARKSDYKAVLGMLASFAGDSKRYSNKNGDSFLKVLSSRDSHLYLAISGRRPVGFITYSVRNVLRYPRPILEVEEMFVLEEFRGLKVGKRLLEHAIDFARKKGMQYIFLASSKERVDAHEFYKHLGFDEYAFHYRRKP